MIVVVVRRLIVGLRNPINYGASEATGSVRTATDMQVKRLWLQAWRAHIAYTLGGAFGPPYIDGVEWSGGDLFPDDYGVPLPPRNEAPPSCLIATLQIEWGDGASFSPGSDSGNTELLRIGPIFVSRGDEWANVLKATTEEGALREFENDLPDQEGLEKTLFVESRRDEYAAEVKLLAERQQPPTPSKM